MKIDVDNVRNEVVQYLEWTAKISNQKLKQMPRRAIRCELIRS